MLPEHPEIAPESVNDFFDGTEIEEALVLHIQALSDQEREEIAAQDPKVREMLARADATTPQQLMDLHGRVRLEDPPGEREVTVDGVTYRRGDEGHPAPAAETRTSTTRCSTAARRRSTGCSSAWTTARAPAPRRHGRRRPDAGDPRRERSLSVLLLRRGRGGVMSGGARPRDDEPPRDTWRPPAADAPLNLRSPTSPSAPSRSSSRGSATRGSATTASAARSPGAWRPRSCPTASRSSTSAPADWISPTR